VQQLLGSPSTSQELVERVTQLAREHLGMDVAYVAEITDARQVFRSVAGDGDSFGIRIGHDHPVAGTYCGRLVSGAQPCVIGDTAHDPDTAALPITTTARIGAFIGVPLTLPDGSVYGAFCCLRHEPDATLVERDAQFMALLARLLVEDLAGQREQGRLRELIGELIARGEVDTAAQPIIDLRDGHCVGVEALARFPEPFGKPESTFATAHEVGLGFALERLAAVSAAQHLLPELDATQFLAINVSPVAARLLSIRAATMPDLPLPRLVAEITEHAAVDSYQALREDLAPLRERGLRIAIDDVGAGYASLHHVVELQPDVIKVDRSLVHGVAADHARRVAVSAFVLLALDLNATVVAEGVETRDDLTALHDLGVDAAQGFLLARPSTSKNDLRKWRWFSAAVHPPRNSGDCLPH
jgi:EAL domain-containing protein (putative c-di-GMP-specific phosphodiesterase class I)